MRKFILLIFAFAFTLGSYAQLSLEGFESTWTAGQGPANWKILQNEVGTITTWAQSPTTNPSITPYQGVYAAYLNRENVGSGIPEDYLVTPLFNVPVNPELRFYSRLTQIGDQGSIYKVKILPEGADADDINNYIELQSWTELEINPAQTEYREIKIDIPQAYVGTQARIAFVMLGDEGDRWLIDNVKVTALCEAPTNLSVANTTFTSAELNWDTPSGSTIWEIEMKADSEATTGSGQMYSGSLPYIVNGLTFDQSYKYFVRAYCTDGGVSAWQGPFYFITPKYGETCEDAIVVDVLPKQYIDNTGSYADNYQGAGGANCGGGMGGNDVVYEYTPTENGLISMVVTNLSDFDGLLNVYTSCADIGLNCYASDAINSAIGELEILDMPVTAGTTYYILMSSEFAPLLYYTLNIWWSHCAAPNAPVASAVQTNGATLSWQENGNATTWQIIVQPQSADAPDAATEGELAFTSSFIKTGLEQNSFYECYVRSVCGAPGQFSNWSKAGEFRTLCSVFDIPFQEGFNYGSQSWDCWEVLDNNADNSFWNFTYESFEGDKAMSMFDYTSDDDWLISPALGLTGTQRLKFNYKTSGNAGFKLMLSTTGKNPADFTEVLLPETVYYNTDYIEKKISLAAYSGPVYIAWKVGVGATTAGGIFIDNVIVEDFPVCTEPSDLAAKDKLANSARLVWEPGYTETNWEVIVQAPYTGMPEDTATGILVSDNELLKTGLQPNTEYEFYVRSVCGADGHSIWSGPFIFRTACTAFDTPFYEGFNTDSASKECWQMLNLNNDNSKWYTSYDPYEGDRGMYVSDDMANDEWLISPAINISANQRLKFHYKAESIKFRVLVSTTGSDPEDFTEVLIPETLYTSAEFHAKKVSLAGYTGPIYIAWVIDDISLSFNLLQLDNIVIENQPLCTEPIDAVVSGITASTAQFSWTPGLDENNWEVLVQPQGGAVPDEASTGEPSTGAGLFKTGLSSNTDYEYYVRSNCGADGKSIWEGPVKFTTECAAFNPPYFEDFESDSTSQECWKVVDLNGETYWDMDNFSSEDGTQNAGMYTYNPENNDWLISPPVNLNGNQRLKYLHKAEGITGYTLLLSTTGRNIEDFTEVLLPMISYDNQEYESKIVSLQSYTGQVYIAWKAAAGYTSPTKLIIDKVLIEDIPSCPEPIYPSVTMTTPYAATLSWTPGNTETQWEVFLQATGSDAPQGSGTVVTAIPYIATTLTNGQAIQQGTTYDFYVRAICSDTDKSILTQVKKVTIPLSNDDCAGAVEIPVNTGPNCEVFASGTVYNATTSPQPTDCPSLGYDDVWFKFTATAALHTVSLKNIVGSYDNMAFAVYSGSCNTLTQISECMISSHNTHNVFKTAVLDLVIGQEYLVRVSTSNALSSETTTFDICVGQPRVDVEDALPFCASDNPEQAIIFNNVSSAQGAADYGPLGCLWATPNPVWYYMQVANSGVLDFQLIQNTLFDAAGNPAGQGLDVDFIAFGPFTSTQQAAQLIDFVWCEDCPDNVVDPGYYPVNTIVDCSYSTAPVENFSIPNALTGEIYVVLITNYSGKAGLIKLQQLPSSTGSTDCNIIYNVSLGDDKILCGADTTEITATIETSNVNVGTIEYTWSVDGQPFTPEVIATTALTQTITISNAGSHVYSVAVSIDGAPVTQALTDEATVAIGPAITIAPQPVLLCNNNDTAEIDLQGLNAGILNSLDPATVSINYYNLEADAVAGTNSIDTSVPFITSGGTLYVKVQSLAVPGCFDIAPLLLNVNTVVIDIAYEDSPYCGGNGTALVTQTGTTGGTYASTAGLDIDTVTGVVNLVTSTPGTYTVSYTIPGYTIPENGLQCNVTDTTITINAPTVPVTGFSYDAVAYCTYDADPVLEMVTGFIPGGIYTSAEGLALNPETGAIDLSMSQPGTYVVTYTVSPSWETCNAQGSTDFTITINPTPAFTLGGPYTACNAQDLTISVTAENFDTGLATYAWTLDGNAVEGDSASLVATDFGTYAVTVTVNGCSSVKTVDVVKDTTVVALAFEEGCNDNDEYILKVISVDGSFDPETASYSWTGTDGFTSDKQEFVVPVKGTYIVTVTTDNGCIGEDFVEVLQTYCEIPKGISPNGDGMNDNFDLSGLDVELVEIFNRYGQEVYSQSNYTNQWHGQSKKGDELPTGTYYYIVQRQNGETKTGWVYINRQD